MPLLCMKIMFHLLQIINEWDSTSIVNRKRKASQQLTLWGNTSKEKKKLFLKTRTSYLRVMLTQKAEKKESVIL